MSKQLKQVSRDEVAKVSTACLTTYILALQFSSTTNLGIFGSSSTPKYLTCPGSPLYTPEAKASCTKRKSVNFGLSDSKVYFLSALTLPPSRTGCNGDVL